MAGRHKQRFTLPTLVSEQKHALKKKRRRFFYKLSDKMSQFCGNVGEHFARPLKCLDIIFDYDPEKHNEMDKIKAELYLQRFLLVICMIGLIINTAFLATSGI